MHLHSVDDEDDNDNDDSIFSTATHTKKTIILFIQMYKHSEWRIASHLLSIK